MESERSPYQERLDTFWDAHNISAESQPLFATEDMVVKTDTYGYDNRRILARSEEMEEIMIREVEKVVEDWRNGEGVYGGIVYVVFTYSDGNPVIRYCGKAGKHGRDGESLSANLKNLDTNKSKFGRWGSGSAYHIGELSTAALDHHKDDNTKRTDPPIKKYKEWYDAFFEDGLKLKEEVHIWISAWENGDTGVHGLPTDLGALEYQLIDMAAHVNPEKLLNSEGVA